MDYNTYFKKSDNRLKLLYKIKKEETMAYKYTVKENWGKNFFTH